MGFFSNPLSALATAINPVAALGTGLAMGGDILGAVGVNATNQANRDIASNANAASLAQADKNIAMEYDFAKNGISWRIADAAKNGIAPLAALGAAEPSASPVNSVFSTPSYDSPLKNIGTGLSNFGQNVSRALLATKSPAERQAQALDLAWKTKQNDLLDVQIANAKLNLAKSSSPGIDLAWRTVMNRDGTTSVVPTSESAQSSHGSFLGPWQWSVDNQLVPAFVEGTRKALEVDNSIFYPQGGTSSGLSR